MSRGMGQRRSLPGTPGWGRQLLAVAILLGVGLPEASASVPRRVAVLGLEVVDLPARLAEQATAAVRNQISTLPGLILVARDAVGLGEAALTFSCIDEAPACLALVGKELGAQLLVYGRLRSHRQQAHLVLHAVDTATGQELATEESIVDLPLVQEGAARLSSLLFSSERSPSQGRIGLAVMQAGAHIYLDDRLVDQAPLATPLAVDPGVHRLRVSLEGFETAELTVQVAGGETKELAVNLLPKEELLGAPALPAEALAPPPPPRAAPAPRGGVPVSTARLLGWGLLGGGVIVAAAGGAFGYATYQVQQDYDAETRQERAQELEADGKSYALTANILFGIGGAMALSGAILLLTSHGDNPPVVAHRGPALRLAPLVAPIDGALAPGALLLGTF
ncbi:MAG: PEGA domain-containing protein [Myxococcota bacterium]|nr:PEGA domain-containing protein [Myxococcota bacterium]